MSTTATRVIVTGGTSSRRRLSRRRRPEHLDRPGQRSRQRRETLSGYGFLVPWLIGFFGLTLVPMVYSLYLSFTSYNVFSPPRWIGLDNYVRMFTTDAAFMQSAQITLIYVLVGTPITLAAALGIAMLLNYRDRGEGEQHDEPDHGLPGAALDPAARGGLRVGVGLVLGDQEGVLAERGCGAHRLSPA